LGDLRSDFGRDWDGKEPEWLETWRALEDLARDGVVGGIGVSNFGVDELKLLVGLAEIQPVAVQNWMDPLHQDKEVRSFCREHGIQYMAYSLLGTQHQYRDGSYISSNPVLENPVIKGIAEKRGLDSTVPVVLSWALSNDVSVIPRSRDYEHIASNWKFCNEMQLSEDEIEVINMLD
jgi:diketogulonate reductase-like aldo/keto reductase